MRCTVGFVFLNKYDATENNPLGGKGGIILKLQNDINIYDGNNGSMILGIMKEVLLARADGVKFKPDMKGQRKTGSKSIIDMDSQEVQITADAVESETITLTSWLLVNNQSKVEEITSVCIYDIGTCIAKLKTLVEKANNKKQVILDRNEPTGKSILLWLLKLSL